MRRSGVGKNRGASAAPIGPVVCRGFLALVGLRLANLVSHTMLARLPK
jgi:hypothetical protein